MTRWLCVMAVASSACVSGPAGDCDCTDEEICVEGTCRAACVLSTACLETELCIEGACFPQSGGFDCGVEADCPAPSDPCLLAPPPRCVQGHCITPTAVADDEPCTPALGGEGRCAAGACVPCVTPGCGPPLDDDFTLSFAQSPVVLAPGGSTAVTLNIGRGADMTAAVELSVDEPAELSAIPATFSTTASSVSVSVTVAGGAAEDTYTVTVTGDDGAHTHDASLEVEVSASVVPPSNLTYTYPDAAYLVGTPITANTVASVSGSPVTSFTSDPLPTGLVLDPVTGAITGTPTVASVRTSFTITAHNSAGSTPCSIFITVSEACPGTSLCVPEAPIGWDGPVVVGQGTTAPDCPGEFPTQVVDAGNGLDAPAPYCPCYCDDPTSSSCYSNTLYYDTGTNCVAQSGCGSVVLPSDGTCVAAARNPISPTCSGPIRGVRMDVPQGTSSCPPVTTGMDEQPAVSWTSRTHVCEGAFVAASCAVDELCVPEPPAGFGSSVCIYRSGDNPCPGGWIADRRVVYADYDDARACGACGCNGWASCSYEAFAYTDGACTNRVSVNGYYGPQTTMMMCYSDATWYGGSPSNPTPMDSVLSAKSVVTVVDAGCVPSAGPPNTTATESAPYTVCCL